MRKRIWLLLSPEDGGLSWFNWLIVGLIFLSLALLAIETEPTLSPAARAASTTANTAILLIFAAEFALRLWACGVDPRWQGPRGHLAYVRRPPLIADFVAFGPELIVIVAVPALANEAMFLRALRLIRVVRLFTYFPTVRRMMRAVAGAGPQLAAGVGVALMTIFLSACVLYLAEARAQPEAFGSIPRALWWAVATLTTVGYGDAYPITAWGKVAAGIAALGGVGVVALPAGVLASAFGQEFRRRAPPPPGGEE